MHQNGMQPFMKFGAMRGNKALGFENFFLTKS